MSGILMSRAHLPTLGLIDFNSLDEYCSASRQSSLMFVSIHQLAARERQPKKKKIKISSSSIINVKLALAVEEICITGAMIGLLLDSGPHRQTLAISSLIM